MKRRPYADGYDVPSNSIPGLGRGYSGRGSGEEVVPMARGKAQAMQTYLATGGGKKAARGESTRGPGTVFKKGKLRGMTQEEAEADFESKWQSVDGSIKDKYAGIAKNSLSPSEQAEYQAKQDRANDSEANFAADLGKSDLIKKGDKDALARAYKRGGELGMSKDEIDAARGAKGKPDTMVPGTSDIVQGPPKPRDSTTTQNSPVKPVDKTTAANFAPSSELTNPQGGFKVIGDESQRPPQNGGQAAATDGTLAGIKGSDIVAPGVLNGSIPIKVVGGDESKPIDTGTRVPVPGVTNAGPAPSAVPSPAPGVAPSAGNVAPSAGVTPASAPTAPTGPKINPLTGKAMGSLASDGNNGPPSMTIPQKPVVATPQQQAGADRMMQSDGVIPSRPQAIQGLVRGPASQEYRAPAPKPTAPNAGVMKSYEDSRQAYQKTLAGGGTDQDHEANKANMDKIYAGASDLDKAGITGQSLKRGAAQVKSESDLMAKSKQGGKVQGVTKAPPVRPF